MAFDQSQILRVNPPRVRRCEIHLSWRSSAPAGTWFQVYADGSLVAKARRRWAAIPIRPGVVRYDVGSVANGEQATSFAGSLPPAPSRRATVSWSGGSHLDPSGAGGVAGFRVYVSTAPAGYGSGGYGSGGYGVGLPSVDYGAPLASIPAYGPTRTDGYGMGGYGSGGYGLASASYSWRSDPLAAGIWGFAVAAYDASGEAGTIGASDLSIQVPPAAPGASQAAPRISCSLAGYGVGPYGGGGYGSQGYGADGYGGGVGYGMSQAVLSWLPSPG